MKNEERLIYANELRQKLNDTINKMYALRIDGVGGILWFIDQIDNAPTVDAVEVVHGQWNFDEELVMWGHPYVCSVCGMANCSMSKYCPNCGAKMDG